VKSHFKMNQSKLKSKLHKIRCRSAMPSFRSRSRSVAGDGKTRRNYQKLTEFF